MINYQAIHQAYTEHKKNSLGGGQHPTPQPEGNSAMQKMVVHAMAMTPNKDGETHGTMIIRALTDHLKRVTPDVGHIHKEPATTSMADVGNVMSEQ